MRFRTAAGPLALSFGALLAGCAGNSGVTPSSAAPSIGGESIARTSPAINPLSAAPGNLPLPPNLDAVRDRPGHRPGIVPERLMPRFALPSLNATAPALPVPKFENRGGKKPQSYVYTSDFVNGNINIYDPATLNLLYVSPGSAGWGIAADTHGHLCFGTQHGYVSCAVLNSYGGFGGTSVLHETVGEAYGIAFTSDGNLWATNFDNGTVDEWSANQVATCSDCNPENSFTIGQIPQPYYLAADGLKLYVEGFDAGGANVLLGTVNTKTHAFKQVLSQPSNTFFPGGITFDKSHTLIWDSQYGAVYAFPKPYKSVSSSVFYNTGSVNVSWTAIALNPSENGLLAAADFTCVYGTYCADVQGASYPLGSLGVTGPVDEQDLMVGITVAPPPKN